MSLSRPGENGGTGPPRERRPFSFGKISLLFALLLLLLLLLRGARSFRRSSNAPLRCSQGRVEAEDLQMHLSRAGGVVHVAVEEAEEPGENDRVPSSPLRRVIVIVPRRLLAPPRKDRVRVRLEIGSEVRPEAPGRNKLTAHRHGRLLQERVHRRRQVRRRRDQGGQTPGKHRTSHRGGHLSSFNLLSRGKRRPWEVYRFRASVPTLLDSSNEKTMAQTK